MRVVEVRYRAVEAEIPDIGGSCASRGGPGRIDRQVIDRLAEGVGEAKRQALLEASTSRNDQPVIVRVATRVLVKDLRVLRVRSEVIKRQVRSTLRIRRGEGIHAAGY